MHRRKHQPHDELIARLNYQLEKFMASTTQVLADAEALVATSIQAAQVITDLRAQNVAQAAQIVQLQADIVPQEALDQTDTDVTVANQALASAISPPAPVVV